MKFTQEQAFESLKRELTNNGKKTLRMSERTLTKLTEILLSKLSDDEIGLPDFISNALEILTTVNENIGKDKSDFIKTWNAEHPEKKPEDTVPIVEKENEKENEKEKDRYEELLKRFEALEQKSLQAEKESKLSAKKKELANLLRNKGVKDSEWIDSLLSEVNITEDLDVESKAEAFVKIYNKSFSKIDGNVTPYEPNNENQDKKPAAIKAAEEMAKKEVENVKKNEMKY